MLADSRDAKFSRGVDGAYFGAYPQEPLSSTIPFMIVCFFLDFVTHFWFRFIDFGPCDDAMISVAPITALRFAQARVLGLMRKNCWTLSAEDRRSNKGRNNWTRVTLQIQCVERAYRTFVHLHFAT